LQNKGELCALGFDNKMGLDGKLQRYRGLIPGSTHTKLNRKLKGIFLKQ
jgi:hypothetical protein